MRQFDEHPSVERTPLELESRVLERVEAVRVHSFVAGVKILEPFRVSLVLHMPEIRKTFQVQFIKAF